MDLQFDLLTCLHHESECPVITTIINDFEHAKTAEDFIKTAMKLYQCFLELRKNQTIPLVYDSKNDGIAKEFLNISSTLISHNKPLENIIEAYNQAMAYALPGSELLAHAYANRSIVLTNAAIYDESLKNIQYALEGNYPDHLKALLYARKAKNLLALDPTANIEETLAEAKKWALKMEEIKRDKFLNDLDKLKVKKFKKPVTQHDNLAYIPKTPDDNPQLLKTSGAVAINYSEKFGKHLIATRDIEAGEALMVKKAYSLIISSGYKFKCCWNCSKFCLSAVHCDKCANVIYCSKECREIAFKEHHEFECPVITAILINKSYIDSLIMSLRLFTKAIKEFGTLEELYKKVQIIDSIDDPIMQLFDNNVYDDTKYSSVYSLFRKPLNNEFKVHNAMKIIWMIHCLSATTEVFGKKIDKFTELVENDWTLFVGKLLFRHYEINVTNMIAIELKKKEDDDQSIISGGMLIPLFDLCSHSCDRNTYSIISRDIISLICIQPIKKGEQINISYSEDYRERGTLERRTRLKTNHGFWCECFPCVNNWGPNHNLPNSLDCLTDSTKLQLIATMTNCVDFCSINSLNSFTSEDTLQLLSKLFKLINLIGKDISYTCKEMNDVKVLLLDIFMWINYHQKYF